MHAWKRGAHSDEAVLVFIATRDFRAASMKAPCLSASETFECSPFANSDVELQIVLDLTVVERRRWGASGIIARQESLIWSTHAIPSRNFLNRLASGRPILEFVYG